MRRRAGQMNVQGNPAKAAACTPEVPTSPPAEPSYETVPAPVPAPMFAAVSWIVFPAAESTPFATQSPSAAERASTPLPSERVSLMGWSKVSSMICRAVSHTALTIVGAVSDAGNACTKVRAQSPVGGDTHEAEEGDLPGGHGEGAGDVLRRGRWGDGSGHLASEAVRALEAVD